jgi:peroxisomal coenzyme A diphosphatase NUDT7
MLCTLEPFVSLHRLVVTPVVAYLTNPSVLGDLVASENEVSCIFTHPLEALLDPDIAKGEQLVVMGSEDWPYTTVLHVREEVLRFPSSYSQR